MPEPVSKIKAHVKAAWEMTTVAFRQWWNDDAFRLASSLAFYTVFSLAPILLVSVGLASLIFNQEEAKHQVIQQIGMMTGNQGEIVARQVLNNLDEIGGSVRAIIVGIAALLLGSTAVFVNLQSALNTIWKVQPAPDAGMIKGFIRDRLRSFGIVLSVGFLLLVSMVFSALVSGIEQIASQQFEALSWIWQFSSFAISFVMATLLFAMVYKYLPDVKIRWRDVLVGAMITAGFFSIGKSLIGMYLGRRAIGSAYGAAGSFVVLLIWIYYSALICFLGAEFTQVYARNYGKRIQPEDHAVRTED
ncbi:MAG: YihY/virulence factor BrkB family protein [Desulfobacterales bacterium]